MIVASYGGEREVAQKYLGVFKALSDTTRVRILLLLADRDLCVCELVFVLQMDQSRISHQLQGLKKADLVRDKREGRRVTYSISPHRKDFLLALFDRLIPEMKDTPESKRDRRNLRICLKKDIRGTCSLVQLSG